MALAKPSAGNRPAANSHQYCTIAGGTGSPSSSRTYSDKECFNIAADVHCGWEDTIGLKCPLPVAIWLVMCGLQFCSCFVMGLVAHLDIEISA